MYREEEESSSRPFATLACCRDRSSIIVGQRRGCRDSCVAVAARTSEIHHCAIIPPSPSDEVVQVETTTLCPLSWMDILESSPSVRSLARISTSFRSVANLAVCPIKLGLWRNALPSRYHGVAFLMCFLRYRRVADVVPSDHAGISNSIQIIHADGIPDMRNLASRVALPALSDRLFVSR